MEIYAAPKLSKYTTALGAYNIKSVTYEINQHTRSRARTHTRMHAHTHAHTHTEQVKSRHLQKKLERVQN